DMFWLPGGNPDLKNEYGTTLEIGWETSGKKFSYLSYNFDITLVRSFIRDMIKWTPGNNSLWYATNLNKVNTAGIESSLSIYYSKGSVNSELTAGYAFTKATDISFGAESNTGQLVYVPSHQLNSTLRLGYRNIAASLLSRYTGRRYTDYDNTHYLPGYFVSDINLSTRYRIKSLMVNTSIAIENVFNTEYQVTAWYPMPRRSYLIKLTFQTYNP
ncbi:MAG: TonB-dependent receptor, partial [Bacteroidales bacterium]|nr:TonB-dependent receptor [Bacteroidales bacterium]